MHDERKVDDDGEDSTLGNLGSLAQSARLKQLNTARWTLIGIGILTILLNGYLLFTAREVAMRELKKQNMVIVNQEEFENSLVFVRLVFAVPLLLGVVFVILGILLKSYPVPMTIVGLVLYVVANLAFMALAPETIAQGLIIKVIIVVALVKAIQAALAYQRDLDRALYKRE